MPLVEIFADNQPYPLLVDLHLMQKSVGIHTVLSTKEKKKKDISNRKQCILSSLSILSLYSLNLSVSLLSWVGCGPTETLSHSPNACVAVGLCR